MIILSLRRCWALIAALGASVGLAACGGGGAATPDERRIALLSFDDRLEVDPQLSSAGVTVPSPLPNRAWAMEGGNAAHVLAHPALDANVERVWRRDLGRGSSTNFRIGAPPVADGGLVFAIDGRGRVTAYDAEDGDQRWSTRVRAEERRDRKARSGGIATRGGRIFVTMGFAAVVALDASTGDEIWRTAVNGPIHAAPTVAEGRVFAVSVDNELYALSAETGEVLWTYQSLAEPARILSPSSPAVRAGIVVAPFASGEVAALQTDNGRPLWTEALTRRSRTTPLGALNDVAGSPVIVGDTVYSISHSGVLSAIDLRSGQRAWTRPASGIHRPWVSGPYLFIVTTDAQLACLSRYDGRVYWTRQLKLYDNPEKRRGKVAWAGPVLAGGRLYLVASDDGEGRLHAFDPSNGEELEAFKLGAEAFIPPIVAQRMLFTVDEEGRLSAFRGRGEDDASG